ncbi:MAG: metallopeptidase TldD-related protein [Gammaproteobacteria bacterium]|nr:metallopeptidase TldD-related protein [Gammaproteobacteria bacterium]
MMQTYFRELSQKMFQLIAGNEIILLNYAGEDSDFVRLNHNKIRQAGYVRQQDLDIDLIIGQKQTSAALQLSGNHESDMTQVKTLLNLMRDQIEFLPDDPYINISTEINNTETLQENQLPDPNLVLNDVINTTKNLDLVGIWASGSMARGFANSLGQFNWHTNHNFNFDWSIYHHDDKAIKQNYAGFKWDHDYLNQKIAFARETLSVLEKPAISIKPGQYRVFLAPSAMQELISMLNWGGFGLKNHRTLQTPLLKMINEKQTMHPHVSLFENTREGVTPPFTKAGFLKPDSISLISKGEYNHCMVSPRSGKEYDQAVNCSSEYAESLELSGGNLHQDHILEKLDTGIFISNLWYCNFSDRNACRITGMTRFACLWVENGKPVAPLNVMRFDESIYNILGNNLVDLTTEHEHILDSGSYHQRSQSSSRLPGALVNDFRFTL